MQKQTFQAYLKASGLSQSQLARRVGVSRQAVSLWFRQQGAQINIHGPHLVRLGRALRATVEQLSKTLPCLDAATRGQLRATLLWDRLFPDLDDLAVAANAGDPRAIGRLVQVYGIYACERMLGPSVWEEFPRYKRYIHLARRCQLEALYRWKSSQPVN